MHGSHGPVFTSDLERCFSMKRYVAFVKTFASSPLILHQLPLKNMIGFDSMLMEEDVLSGL